MGSSSCFLYSPINPFLSSPFPRSPSSSSSLSLPSHPLFLYVRNGEAKRRISRAQMAPLPRHLGPQDFDSCKKRALLLLGFSIFPLLPWRDEAFVVLANASENEQKSENKNPKQELTGRKPSNPIMSLLNAIGILGSGVLAAFYSIARKDNVTSDAMIESLNSQLKEKDATIDSLKKNFEAKLLHLQEEQNKLLGKAKEEQLSLVNHLESVNATISALGHDLQNEKRKIEEFEGQIENLDMKLGEVGEHKQALEDKVKEKDSSIVILQENINLLSADVTEREEAINSLSSSLAQKDSGLKILNSAYEQTKDDLVAITSEIMNLKDELMKNQNELGQRNSAIDDLSNRMNCLTTERDSLTTRLGTLEQEYNNLKSSSMEKAASEAKLLEDMESDLGQLREKYELAVSDVSAKQAVISDMTQDRDGLKKMLLKEVDYVETLKQELQSTEAALGSSRNEASDLNKQLDESKRLSLELEAAFSKAQAEFHQARESLQKSLDEATLNSDATAGEFASVKAALDKTKNELQMVSSEMEAINKNQDTLQKVLVEACNQAEVATNVLKQEKGVVAVLTKDLQALEKQALKDKEVKKSLDSDLEEATRSLEEVSKSFLMVSKDLEEANARFSSLQEEKDLLSNALEKEKKVAVEAREVLKNFHSLVMRLGSERESLAKRVKKLEEDLASAKGEILRLRSQINSSKSAGSSKEPVNIEPIQEDEPAGDSTPKGEGEPAIGGDSEQEVEPAVNKESKRAVTTSGAPVKRSGRRRRANTQ